MYKRMEKTILVKYFDDSKMQDILNTLLIVENEAKEVNDNNMGENMLPILTLRISSYGGDVDVCDAIISQIEMLKTLGVLIITECLGYACSCGMLLFMHGDVRRFINKKFSYLLWHSMKYGQSSQKMNNSAELLRHAKHIYKIHNDYLIKKTKITKQMLKEKENCEWYIYYKEALELGIVTE